MAEQAYFDPNQPPTSGAQDPLPGADMAMAQQPGAAYDDPSVYQYDPAYDPQYDPYYAAQPQPASVNPILTILAGVFSVVLLVAWLLEAGVFGAHNPLALSTILGLGKAKTTIVTTSQQDPSGYGSCVQKGGRTELTLPRSCFVDNTVFFETIPGGDIAAYTAGVEAEAATKNQLVFKPKKYGVYDRISDSTAVVPDALTYTYKESNKITYKMQVYGKATASVAGVTSPTASIADLGSADDKKGYDTANGFIVPATTSLVGEGVVVVYAKARDNYVIMLVPMKDNAGMKKEGDTCAVKKYDEGSFNDRVKQCFADAVKNNKEIQADAKVLMNQLLDNFQL
jgi:hypothetical protein